MARHSRFASFPALEYDSVSFLTLAPPGAAAPGHAGPGNAALPRRAQSGGSRAKPPRIHLSRAGKIRLAVYDLLRREVALLVEGVTPAGSHLVHFDGSRLASGVYYCRLETGGRSLTRAMGLLK